MAISGGIRAVRVNRKRVQRLMRLMGLEAIYPKPKTSEAAKEHRKYPYLLRGVEIVRPNQVWSTDITYLPLPKGFMYLVAVMDWYSRYVLSWRLSNTLDSGFCVDALETALKIARPEIFNSDQGAQFTCREFTGRLERAEIAISMDGRGRALDNVFVEVILAGRSNITTSTCIRFNVASNSTRASSSWIGLNNQERGHFSLETATTEPRMRFTVARLIPSLRRRDVFI